MLSIKTGAFVPFSAAKALFSMCFLLSHRTATASRSPALDKLRAILYTDITENSYSKTPMQMPFAGVCILLFHDSQDTNDTPSRSATL